MIISSRRSSASSLSLSDNIGKVAKMLSRSFLSRTLITEKDCDCTVVILLIPNSYSRYPKYRPCPSD